MGVWKNTFKVYRNIIFYTLAIILFFCSGSVENFPQEIYQDDVCASCKMIISDLQFASQCKAQKEGILKFDDINCMVSYLKKNQLEIKSTPAYVVDFFTKEWINTDDAHFVVSTTVKTPMMSGIVAFKNTKNVEKVSGNSSGKIYTFRELLMR